MNKKLYPLKFTPIEVERAWGSESWDVAAMGDGQNSIVSGGYLADNGLDDILETYLGDLVGDSIFDYYNMQFPLLVKRLDVRENLSVQVHPDDETAYERFYDYGKTECWHILEAEDTARVYMGFKRDTSAGEFYEKCKDGTVTELMNVWQPKAGETYFIPAGTVHACGGGLKIAEVQEPSDITFRLYDWGRENNPATARPMLLEEALDIIDYNAYDEAAYRKAAIAGNNVLADCEHFTFSRKELNDTVRLRTEDFKSFIIYMCISGAAVIRVEGNDQETVLRNGECVLIPASLDDAVFSPLEEGTVLLEAYIREIKENDRYINEGVAAELPEENEGRNPYGYYKN